MSKTVLAIGAHPDDVELGCGATLAKEVSNGKKIGNLPLIDYRISEGMVELTVSAFEYHSQTEFMNIKRDQNYAQVSMWY